MSQLFFAATRNLALCPTIPAAIAAPRSCISSLAAVIIDNPDWRAPSGAICFWQSSKKSASAIGLWW